MKPAHKTTNSLKKYVGLARTVGGFQSILSWVLDSCLEQAFYLTGPKKLRKDYELVDLIHVSILFYTYSCTAKLEFLIKNKILKKNFKIL